MVIMLIKIIHKEEIERKQKFKSTREAYLEKERLLYHQN